LIRDATRSNVKQKGYLHFFRVFSRDFADSTDLKEEYVSHTVRWTVQKITQRLALIEPLVYRRRAEIEPFRYTPLPGPEASPLMSADVDDSTWETIAPETYWGAWGIDFMLRARFAVPTDWQDDAPVALYLPLGEAGDFSHPEALAYIDGAPYAACDRHHQEILLPANVHDGKLHMLALHGWTGLGGWRGVDRNTKLFMRPCAVVQIDQPTRDFIATARVALGIASNLDTSHPTRGQLLGALDDAFKRLDMREPFGEAFYQSIAPAHAALRAGIDKAGPPMDVEIVATGHAHIDVAWLWTLAQTRRKAGRTFHTVLRLMEQFPDYHFTQSQPQLYDYVRQDYPELFEAIKQHVAEGRWEITGDMWVEADCNLSGPESLARQFLLGRQFFREHFGVGTSSRVLWLPDVFGYAWALPQLIKQADLEYFFTIKIGWSQYNRLPYDSFWWQGLDGTRVLTHFSPTPEEGNAYASTYNARATPYSILGTWTNFQQKDLEKNGKNPPLLMAFGYGDGGGGPTREMLENIRETAHFPATPQIRQAHVGEFFKQLEEIAGDRLPTWNGELYLELHRGTYTTQSRNKRANRKSEFLLHDAEFLATLAAHLDPQYEYPAAALRKGWELVCLNQFHDIIPGSSIGAVYVDSLKQYDEIRELGDSVRDGALAVIADAIDSDMLIINPTSFARSDLAFWHGHLAENEALQRPDGELVATQPVEGGTLIDLGKCDPFSVIALRRTTGDGRRETGDDRRPTTDDRRPTTDGPRTTDHEPRTTNHGQTTQHATRNTQHATQRLLENDFLRIELNEAGDITRIYDKAARREVLAPGAVGNQFQAFEDRPMNWDAWDVDIFYDDKIWLAEPASSVQVIEAGPLRATLEIRRRILNSPYVQRISLNHNSPRLDVETTIDWRERHVMLKVAFPVDILAPVATYEIQWGHVQRPTHRNTNWDWARFETCAQKWVDLSEGDYGVSLLNDCKYGHDIRDNVMRISLLRSPTMPDPEADQGEHRFAYSLLPHSVGLDATIREAYALNDPMIVYAVGDEGRPTTDDRPPTGDGGRTTTHSPSAFVSVDRPNIIIETIKRAEDGNGIIVRGYEGGRRRGPITLTAGFEVAEVWRTNVLEENQAALEANGNSVTFSVRPFEIVTLRLVPRK
jgi:alpha-mannosidase